MQSSCVQLTERPRNWFLQLRALRQTRLSYLEKHAETRLYFNVFYQLRDISIVLNNEFIPFERKNKFKISRRLSAYTQETFIGTKTIQLRNEAEWIKNKTGETDRFTIANKNKEEPRNRSQQDEVGTVNLNKNIFNTHFSIRYRISKWRKNELQTEQNKQIDFTSTNNNKEEPRNQSQQDEVRTVNSNKRSFKTHSWIQYRISKRRKNELRTEQKKQIDSPEHKQEQGRTTKSIRVRWSQNCNSTRV